MQSEPTFLDRLGTWLGGAAAAGGMLWNWMPEMVQLLVLLQTADIITGIWAAARFHSVASREMRLVPKVTVLLVVALAYAIDLKLGLAIAPAVCGWYCAKEGLSLIENVGRLGVPVPPKLRRVFRVLGEGERKGQE